MATFEVALKPDRIIAGIEDEQGSLTVGTVLLLETTAQSQDLLAGNVVGILVGPDPACVDGSDPRVALEGKPGDELVGPSCYDRLAGGVAAGW